MKINRNKTMRLATLCLLLALFAAPEVRAAVARPFGGSVQNTSALQTGQIAAGTVEPPVSFYVERNGFHSLALTLINPIESSASSCGAAA